MTINIERFKQVREAVAANPDFDMGTYIHPCGTAACILGSAQACAYPDTPLHYWKFDEVRAGVWLGLSTEQIYDDEPSELDFLQYGMWSDSGMSATKEEALLYLDKVIETGDVFQTVSIYELEGA